MVGPTIEKCLNFTKADLLMMKRTNVEAIATIPDEAFTLVFVDRNKAMTKGGPISKKDVVKLIHIHRLHRAPCNIENSLFTKTTQTTMNRPV